MKRSSFLQNLVLPTIIFLMILSASSSGQQTGSPYTRYGIGDLNYYPNSGAAGMGGASVAIPSNTTIDFYNPAAWTRLNLTRYSIGAGFKGLTTTDASSSARYGNLNFNDVMLAIPLYTPRGIVMAFGLSSYSTVGYSIQQQVIQSGFDYTLHYTGQGGLSQAHFGISTNLSDNLHVGAKFNYFFGTINHNISQNLSNSLYSNSSIERKVPLSGHGVTFGAIYSGLSNILHLESSSLNLGISLTTTSYLSVNQENYIHSSNGGNITNDTVIFASRKLKLPFTVITGIAYITERYTLASDVAIQNWNDPYVIGILVPLQRNTIRWGIGGEFTPKRESSAPYFQKTSYRLGMFYNASYYVVNNEPLNEFGFTGGFGLPLFGDTRLNIAAEYATRGTLDYNLQKEKIFRMTFSITGGEPWFERPNEE